jgi:hypothetical protein
MQQQLQFSSPLTKRMPDLWAMDWIQIRLCVLLYNNKLMSPYNNSGVIGPHNGNNFYTTVLGYSQGPKVTIQIYQPQQNPLTHTFRQRLKRYWTILICPRWIDDHISRIYLYDINRYFQNLFDFITSLTQQASAGIIPIIFLNTIQNIDISWAFLSTGLVDCSQLIPCCESLLLTVIWNPKTNAELCKT